jgi:D-xylose 1-dehydrogenase (NADP+, D-xylono-1,5-lactone-forming)
MKKLRLGIMGLGKIAVKSMIPALKDSEKVVVTAVGSRSLEKSEKTARVHGIDHYFGSYSELIESKKIDAIYIALPNHLHCEWAIASAKQGLHILCEKPLATKVEEAQAMIKAATDNEVVILEAFMYRMHPQHQIVKRMIADNKIGEIHQYEASFCYSLSDLNNIRLKKDCLGGALMDVGCYLIDSARWLLESEVDGLQCFKKIGKESGVDERTTISLKLKNGITCNLLCSTDMQRENKYRVLGSKGSMIIDNAFVPAINKRVNIKIKTENGEEIIKINGINQYKEECEAFADFIYNDKEIDLESGLENIKVLERIGGYE